MWLLGMSERNIVINLSVMAIMGIVTGILILIENKKEKDEVNK